MISILPGRPAQCIASDSRARSPRVEVSSADGAGVLTRTRAPEMAGGSSPDSGNFWMVTDVPSSGDFAPRAGSITGSLCCNYVAHHIAAKSGQRTSLATPDEADFPQSRQELAVPIAFAV